MPECRQAGATEVAVPFGASSSDMGLIRVLLALSVVFDHSVPFVLTGTRFVGGLTAVEAFFLISGFYMALVLEGKYEGRKRVFYRNRFLRIYPTYWAAMAVAVLAGAFVASADRFGMLLALKPGWPAIVLMLSANALLFGSGAMMFLSVTGHGLAFAPALWGQPASSQLFRYHYIPQAWTLPLELTFYLLAPFLVRRTRLLAGLVAGAFAVRLITYRVFGAVDPWNYRFFPSELGLFCTGMLVHDARIWLKPRIDLARWGAPALAVMVVFTLFYEFTPLPEALRVYAYVGALAVSLPSIFERFKTSRLDRELGELSYPIYICHNIVLSALLRLPFTIHGDRSIVNVAACLIAAWALDRGVSRPVERRFKAT